MLVAFRYYDNIYQGCHVHNNNAVVLSHKRDSDNINHIIIFYCKIK